MRTLGTAVSVLILGTFLLAQQAKPPKSRVKKTAPPPATTTETTPAAAQTPTHPVPAAKPAEAAKESKELRFDMTEVPPVVTHQQATVNGRVLRYTATAGRLPIKRADGQIEAEMFFVAYTLDGRPCSRAPGGRTPRASQAPLRSLLSSAPASPGNGPAGCQRRPRQPR